ncbi:MAG: DUF4505 family protein [Leptospirales bacterium]|nr:DUF4505 family protein [Leptospirales bacterium]
MKARRKSVIETMYHMGVTEKTNSWHFLGKCWLAVTQGRCLEIAAIVAGWTTGDTLEREYFYTIDRQGRLFHDGTELSDPAFLDFFFARLKSNDTGSHPEYPYLSPCGRELNFIKASHTPMVFQKLVDGKLYYAPGLSVVFDPVQLRYAGNAEALLYPAPVGQWGLLNRELIIEMGRSIESFGPYYAYVETTAHTRVRLHVIEPLELDSNIVVFRPETGTVCFGCGAGNDPGIALPFLYFKNSGQAHSWFTPPGWMAGHPQFMHGGFISLLLDEVMAKAMKGQGFKGFTANLNVDFKQPCKIGEPLELKAILLRRERRKVFLSGEILNQVGGVLAVAQGLFVVTEETR